MFRQKQNVASAPCAISEWALEDPMSETHPNTTDLLGQSTLGSGICETCGHPRTEHPNDDICWAPLLVDGKVVLCRCQQFVYSDMGAKLRRAAGFTGSGIRREF
jgi:hypothetical protein